MSVSAALLTPTYGKDLQRFTLLRASLEDSGCTLPHVAVVQTEDLPAFRRHGFAPEVTLIASADVLPAPVERDRLKLLALPTPLRKAAHSLYKRWQWPPIASHLGWNIQQIVKLGVSVQLPYERLVSVDSDLVLTQPRPLATLAGGADCPLCTHTASSAWHPYWDEASAKLLGVPVPQAVEGRWRNPVVHPFVFDARTLALLRERLEALGGKAWWQVLLGLPMWRLSEYTLYTAFVEHTLGMAGHAWRELGRGTQWLRLDQSTPSEVQAFIERCFADPEVDWFALNATRHYPAAPWDAAIRQRLRT